MDIRFDMPRIFNNANAAIRNSPMIIGTTDQPSEKPSAGVS